MPIFIMAEGWRRRQSLGYLGVVGGECLLYSAAWSSDLQCTAYVLSRRGVHVPFIKLCGRPSAPSMHQFTSISGRPMLSPQNENTFSLQAMSSRLFTSV